MSRYSQTGEHLKVIEFIGDLSHGFYIDVGCNEPFHDNVSSYFYDKGWNGICIDANKRITEEFKRQRPRDIVVNCGVSDVEGEFTYHDFGGGGGLNTFDKNIAEHVSTMGFASTTTKVEVRTLTNILSEYEIPSIDFLKIDVEGLDFSVIKSLDFELYRPKLLLYEYPALERLNIHSYCQEYLINKKYKFVHDDGLNYYYIDDK